MEGRQNMDAPISNVMHPKHRHSSLENITGASRRCSHGKSHGIRYLSFTMRCPFNLHKSGIPRPQLAASLATFSPARKLIKHSVLPTAARWPDYQRATIPPADAVRTRSPHDSKGDAGHKRGMQVVGADVLVAGRREEWSAHKNSPLPPHRSALRSCLPRHPIVVRSVLSSSQKLDKKPQQLNIGLPRLLCLDSSLFGDDSKQSSASVAPSAEYPGNENARADTVDGGAHSENNLLYEHIKEKCNDAHDRVALSARGFSFEELTEHGEDSHGHRRDKSDVITAARRPRRRYTQSIYPTMSCKVPSTHTTLREKLGLPELGSWLRNRCPNRHPLMQFCNVQGQWYCSSCDQDIFIGDDCYGCRMCNYDLCTRCFSDK
eukprot:GEMP01028575.1.p1 GENE.GEMP01028575.1~~GEMP01028575.1.p1  ORF type:complete len:398 (+),score=43.76 GEMP01028575.1:67-1194(+)